MTSKTAEYDVVIVGGGHNGLVAGAYLAKAGKRVLLAERAARAGGFSQSDYMIPEAPAHMVNTGAGHLLTVRMSKILKELELAKHGWSEVTTDPMYAYLAPNGDSIALFRSVRRTAEDIARFSKADAQAYLEFMELMDAVLQFAGVLGQGDPGVRTWKYYVDFARTAFRNRRLREKLELIQTAPADQLAMEWFEHPYTRAFMLGMVCGPAPFDVDGNAIAYALFGLYHRVGSSNAVGGMRMVADALTSAFEAAGGELLLNAHVDEIIIENGRCRGIRVGNRVIDARSVVATCGPGLVADMATPGGLDRVTKARLEYAPANRGNVGPALLNVATSRLLTLPRHNAKRPDGVVLDNAVGLIGSAEELQIALAQSRRGMVPTTPVFSVLPLSSRERMAPDGQSVAYIYLPVFPVEVNEGWSKLKAPAEADIMATAAKYYDGFDSELGRWFELCPERGERTGATNGAVAQVDFGALRMGAHRPAFGLGGPRPLVPGLFLGGSAIHPGGGVSGMAGRLAAQRVSDYLAQAGR